MGICDDISTEKFFIHSTVYKTTSNWNFVKEKKREKFGLRIHAMSLGVSFLLSLQINMFYVHFNNNNHHNHTMHNAQNINWNQICLLNLEIGEQGN